MCLSLSLVLALFSEDKFLADHDLIDRTNENLIMLVSRVIRSRQFLLEVETDFVACSRVSVALIIQYKACDLETFLQLNCHSSC